ncbi:MAG: FISUMP domain-containing protein [Bacteroidales bacterium]
MIIFGLPASHSQQGLKPTGSSAAFNKSTVSDIDGNTYKTVIIGKQEWMAENLKVTTYNDGTPIQHVRENSAWQGQTSGAYCWYENDSASWGGKYGALYNWYAINTTSLCPQGWHVAGESEWISLKDYLSAHGYKDTEGTALKSTTGWGPSHKNTDNYGFNALPGGYRHKFGSFSGTGGFGRWWTATQINTHDAWFIYLSKNRNQVLKRSLSKKNGLYVRCLKN